MRDQQVEQHDVQGGILCGYHFRFSLHLGLHVEQAEAGRAFLGALAPRITTAVPWGPTKPERTVNVALSWPGLAALGASERLLNSFPDEFREGMRARAGWLGDEGVNDPSHWEPWWDEGRAHVLVTLNAQTEAGLRAAREEVLRGAGHGLSLAGEQRGAGLPGAREHFGFADGFAQPSIADDHAGPWHGQGTATTKGRIRQRPAWEPLQVGEFIHGYRDEDLLESPGAPGKPLHRNGTYLVVRKLEQDVAAFWTYLRDQAGGDAAEAERLAAKVVGRWPNGTPLATSPDGPDPAIDTTEDRIERLRMLNDFRYRDDPVGLRCPIGAHVRRVNPRDHFGDGRLTRRHRIIRRGMPYGPPPADKYVDDGRERGLLFVSFQASILRQFEFIQARWCNDGDAFGLARDKDLLLSCGDPRGKMTVNGHPPQFLHPSPEVVRMRGGGYFYAPGLGGLKLLIES